MSLERKLRESNFYPLINLCFSGVKVTRRESSNRFSGFGPRLP